MKSRLCIFKAQVSSVLGHQELSLLCNPTVAILKDYKHVDIIKLSTYILLIAAAEETCQEKINFFVTIDLSVRTLVQRVEDMRRRIK